MRRFLSLSLLASTALLAGSLTCQAATPDLLYSGSGYLEFRQLALSDVPESTPQPELLLQTSQPEGPSDAKKTAGQMHKYLGYTTIALACLTALSSNTEDLHHSAAYATAGAAALTVGLGAATYGEGLNLDDGLFTKVNRHALLGTIGAIGCLTAAALADDDGGHGHASAGVIGGTMMTLGVITIRW